VVAADALGARALELASAIAAGGPNALAACKRLIAEVAHAPLDAALAARTAGVLASLRATDEAQEGLAAARDKRAPAWRR
jgi:methylglutaconyl-CoA hydratase